MSRLTGVFISEDQDEIENTPTWVNVTVQPPNEVSGLVEVYVSP